MTLVLLLVSGALATPICRRRAGVVLLAGLALAPVAQGAPGDEISASRGRKGGVVVLYPRIVPATDDAEIQALAGRLQARLQATAAASGVPPARIDVRPAPERVCPRVGCRGTSLGVMLGHQDGGCAVLAVVGPPGPEARRLVPLAGAFELDDPGLPFRTAPEDRVVVSEFVPCAEAEASLDAAALGQLLSGSAPLSSSAPPPAPAAPAPAEP